MIVQNIIESRTKVHVLRDDCSLREAAKFLRDTRIGGAPVVNAADKLVGFCSERDLVYRVMAPARDPEQLRVADIMTTEVVTATAQDKITACEAKLRKAHCRHLPIVEGDKVVACLSMRDFLQSELRECKLHLEQLTDYIQGAGG